MWFAAGHDAALAQTPPSANVQADLLSSRATVAPGERFTIVLRQRIRDGWHTYWRNPGDSGQPTRIGWHLPAGWRAGDIQWLAPVRMRFATLMSYVYSNEVLFPIELTAPREARPGENVSLTADGDWLVCSDICIPEHAALSLTVAIAAQGRDDPQWRPRIARAVAALPRRLDAPARITRGTPAVLSIAVAGASSMRDPYFFPYSQNAIAHAASEQPRAGAQGLSFRLAQGVDRSLGDAPLLGVVTYEGVDGQSHAFEIEASPGAALPGTDASPATGVAAEGGSGPVQSSSAADVASVLTAMVLALIGGLILNLMPCVLPVLSVKALSLAGGAHAGRARREGVLYAVGVLSTFLLLAAVLIAVRNGGATVGWGFQLQTAWVTAALALLFFAIGLNLLGVFTIGGVENAGAGLASRRGDAGAFFTGALAVVAATPCTAPFMAGAIGVALTQSAAAALAIFAALGAGFALPLTALSFLPSLQRWLPKPGAWMERVRNVLAFPMFGAAAWLAWVLAQQSGATGVLALLALATALAFAVLVARWGRIWLIVGAATLAVTLLFAWRPLTEVRAPAEVSAQTWSAARVAELRARGRPIFVNFTAAWCITCKVNEATTFSSPRVRDAMRARGIVYLEADWTNRDDAIAAELAAHGRAGVPLYLYYPPGGGEPVVLPQILNEAVVLNAIGA
ncbi:MAG: thioredoxin family protein [Proteobacteria bacterium]|nr:thioredoxin family protein [Pseudomonadota bacterium]